MRKWATEAETPNTNTIGASLATTSPLGFVHWKRWPTKERRKNRHFAAKPPKLMKSPGFAFPRFWNSSELPKMKVRLQDSIHPFFFSATVSPFDAQECTPLLSLFISLSRMLLLSYWVFLFGLDICTFLLLWSLSWVVCESLKIFVGRMMIAWMYPLMKSGFVLFFCSVQVWSWFVQPRACLGASNVPENGV